jgi:hypothetical protein
MARKLPPAGKEPVGSSAVAASEAAAELAVMQPDIELPIDGRQVRIREYGFFEGLEVAHRLTGFIDDMAKTIGKDLRYDRVRRLFGVHRDQVIPAAALSADVEPEWVAGLKGNSAELFMSTWFGVNAGFFVREAVVSMREARLATASSGPTSSSASPAPDSATQTASDGAPSGN